MTDMLGGVITLAIDVGGSSIKASLVAQDGALIAEPAQVTTPYPCPPPVLVDTIAELAATLPGAQRACIGFPGLVRTGTVIEVPSLSRRSYAGPTDPDLTAAWGGFRLQEAVADRLGIPVRAVNDADMAGCAVARGTGMEFVVTLGTGIGTALFLDGRLLPHLELSHLSFPGRRESFDILVGNSALRRIGQRRWIARVHRMMAAFHDALWFDQAYLGGGNARLFIGTDLPENWSVISNTNGLIGAVRIWDATTD